MPILPLAKDLAYILGDAGDPVVFGRQRTHGKIKRVPNEVLTEGGLEVKGYRVTLLVAADDPALADVVVGSKLTVAGTRFTVRDLGAVNDNQRTYTLAVG